MSPYHIAVIDVGKTNKKVLIYNSNLELEAVRVKRFEEIDRGDYSADDLSGFVEWMFEALHELAASFDIRVISVSTHGAAFVAVDANGQVALPPVSYTTDPGPEFHGDFYRLCGDRIALQKITATPDFNLLINLAKGIYFAQRRFPSEFQRVQKILPFPQYLGYLLTGRTTAEPTYTGNHSYLWDFGNHTWSMVADRLEIRPFLPDTFLRPWDILGTVLEDIRERIGVRSGTVVTAGVHDSNASLLPYLLTRTGDFLLNSTGTWCVIMKEAERVNFADDELGKVVFFNLDAFSKPVKTAIFMGGLEYGHYARLFEDSGNPFSDSEMDISLYQQVIDEKKLFILPGVVGGSGQFPESSARIVEGEHIYSLMDIEHGRIIPRFFQESALGQAVLNLSLAVQTRVCFERVGMEVGLPIYTEGGFRRNNAYNALMATLYPDSDFFLSDLKEATAFGAALLGKAAFEKLDPYALAPFVNINTIPVPKSNLQGLDSYAARFMELI